jgi:hypothetical protein
MSKANFPEFPENTKNPIPDLDAEDVALFVLATIGMEELGLSHILNAEGEKIQWILGTLKEGAPSPAYPTVDEVLKINQAVLDTVEAVVTKNMILNMKAGKMLRVLEYAQETAAYQAAPAPAPVQP